MSNELLCWTDKSGRLELRLKKVKLVLFFLLFALSTPVQAEHWVINTLEWPPFTCSRCPENGAAIKALKQTLKSVGVTVEFVFYSWTQAMKKGRENKNVVGVFPAWPGDIKPGLVPSEVLFHSPIGFIEPINRPLKWQKLSDLKGKTIGMTQDYGYDTELLALVKKGDIKAEIVLNDETNFLKVALEKLDGAVMDVNNARYVIYMTQRGLAGRVSVNSRIIQNESLHIAFNDFNKEKSETLSRGLKKVNFQRIVDDYMVKYLRRPN